MSSPSLRRYTSLPAAINILRRKELTLTDPTVWEDRNDRHFLHLYAKAKCCERTLALCFCRSPETHHHWRAFGHGDSGVCIEFDDYKLAKAVEAVPDVRARPMIYRTIETMAMQRVKVEDLPFLKRYAFRPEKEFRWVALASRSEELSRAVAIDVGCISQVHLSPWLPRALADDTRELLQSIPGCEQLPISRSTLLENDRWKTCGDDALRMAD